MSLFDRFRRVYPALPTFVDVRPNFWTQEDAAAWLAFRQSKPGLKLGVILNNRVVKSATDATRDLENTVHSCGKALGTWELVQLLDEYLPEQISPVGAQSGNFEGGRDQDQDSFAHLRP